MMHMNVVGTFGTGILELGWGSRMGMCERDLLVSGLVDRLADKPGKTIVGDGRKT
jgi:hypothetical protein